jgi:hypothetical protein
MKILLAVSILGAIACSALYPISITEASKLYTMSFSEWVVVWITSNYLQSLPSGASVWFRTEKSENRPDEFLFYLWVFIWDEQAEQAYLGPKGIVNKLKEYIRNDCSRWAKQGYNINFDTDIVFSINGPS